MVSYVKNKSRRNVKTCANGYWQIPPPTFHELVLFWREGRLTYSLVIDWLFGATRYGIHGPWKHRR
jgi:hypothetical protein